MIKVLFGAWLLVKGPMLSNNSGSHSQISK